MKLRNGWDDDERVTHEPPQFWDPAVVLYAADGTPLKRAIGFQPPPVRKPKRMKRRAMR